MESQRELSKYELSKSIEGCGISKKKKRAKRYKGSSL